MTKRRNNSPPQLWVTILDAVLFKGLASNGLKCSTTVEGSEEMASSLYLVSRSSAAWRCESQNKMNGSQVPNFKREVAGLRP
jgi:hypothetical protein